jgi:diguanylate cyclase (GGDEF)-like protein
VVEQPVMSPRVQSLLPRPEHHRLIAAGLLGGLLAASLVLAGWWGAAGGFLACIPAAVLAGWARGRLEVRQEGLRLLSQVDPLTSLGNRRLLHQRMAYEIVRHRRTHRRVALLALDLDGFKQVNERFGHMAGDEILREVAKAMDRAVREQDTVVRWGGDEFCVLAPETGWHEAERLAVRLRSAVARAAGELEGLSVSVGYAVFPDEGATPQLLIARADAAGGEAKRRSRAERDAGAIQLRAV